MVKLASDDVGGSGATVLGLLADHLRISESSLLISTACTGSSLEAWISNSGCEASACGKSVLGRLGAGQATRLAPAEEAVCLAVLGTVLASRCVALRACRSDANGCSEAAVELVMIKLASDDVEGCGAAVVGLLANNLRISESSLLISTACTGSSLEA